MKLRATFILIVALCLHNAQAAMETQENLLCPVNGKVFTHTLPKPAKAKGHMLDMQPYGAVVSPFPLPVCSDDGFVVYKDSFTPAQVQALMPLIEQPDFKKHPVHYRAFLMMQQLHEPLTMQLRMLQEASWNGTDDYRRQALSLLEKILSDRSLTDRARLDHMLLKAEFERRLGLFESATHTLNTLEPLKLSSLGFFAKIIQCQKQLVDAKNTNTAPVPNEHMDCGQDINTH